MDLQQIDLINIISELGLPSVLVIFLLISFQKKLEKLCSLIDRLTGIVLATTKSDRGDV